MNQFERWITSKEAFVFDDDLGDSLPAVDELLKNHTNLTNSLLAYEDQARKLTTVSEELLESRNYNDKVIKKTTLVMNEKWKGLKASARDKQTKLEESKLLQQFLQDCNEVKNVFNERMDQLISKPVIASFYTILSHDTQPRYSATILCIVVEISWLSIV